MKSDLEEMKSLHYDHKAVEDKWRTVWHDNDIDVTDIALNASGKRKKPASTSDQSTRGRPFYNLMMFPYPSAEGLHVGNMYAFTGTDILGRFKRMQGYEVFEPIGLDGFGIHSENFALKIGRHPMDHAKITQENFYKQMHRIGAMYDWTRTVETYDPDYYRWTQWLFVQMFKHGLAYRGKAMVNFCPSCKTVLSDEQVIDGACERCGNMVEKRLLEQWFFRITAYAEKLLQNTFSLNWTEKVLVAQRNWIGKKTGINISYKVKDSDLEVLCFTTTPVNFAATFLVLSPEHPLAVKLATSDHFRSVNEYIDSVKGKKDADRIAQGREKTGVFTGSYAINHVTGEELPIWVSDFVLMGVGTGAIQACPGHDMRDFEFAKKFGLPIKRVVVGEDGDESPIDTPEQVVEHSGAMVNSEFLNGLPFEEAMEKTKDYFEKNGWGKRVATYHLRDWLISRQRYWGPPIPMIYCQTCADAGRSWFTSKVASSIEHGVSSIENTREFDQTRSSNLDTRNSMAGWYPVPEDQLPVILPRIEDYKPGNDGIAPLAKHKEFYETKCPGCGGKAVRETDVSDTFLDSSWYFLRYPSVGVDGRAPSDLKSSTSMNFGESIMNYGKNVKNHNTQYIDHNSERNTDEQKSSAMLPWDREITKTWLPVSVYTGGAEHAVLHLMYSRFVTMALHDWKFIDFDEPFPHFFAHGLIIKDGAKMSKSKGNVVNPDEYIDRYGADALRLYLMFTGPYGQGGDFRDSAMEGTYRWLNRVWRIANAAISLQPSAISQKEPQFRESSGLLEKALNRLTKKVGEDIERRSYNTAIAAMMEFTNLVTDNGGALSVESLKTFLKLLAPFAPYMTEELWEQIAVSCQLSAVSSIHLQPWPSFDSAALVDETVEIVIQVNGKVRDKVMVPQEMASDKEKLTSLAQKSDKVLKFTTGKTMIKTIVVPGRLVNIVI